jgi:hypothetical protein
MVAVLDAAWAVLKADPRYQLYTQTGSGAVPLGFDQSPYHKTYEQTRLGTVHSGIAGLLTRLDDMRGDEGRFDAQERYRRFGTGSVDRHGNPTESYANHIAGLAQNPENDLREPPSFRVDAGQLRNMIVPTGARGRLMSHDYPVSSSIHYDNRSDGFGPQREVIHETDKLNPITNVMDDFEFGPIQLPQEPIPGIPGGGHYPHLGSRPKPGFVGEVYPRDKHSLANFGAPISILATSRGTMGGSVGGPRDSREYQNMKQQDMQDIQSIHMPETDAMRVYPAHGLINTPYNYPPVRLPAGRHMGGMEQLGQELAQNARPTAASQFDFAFDQPQFDLSGL